MIQKKLKKFLPKLQRAPHLLLLLDFDGTLSPIVRRPHLAKLHPKVRKELNRFSRLPDWTIAVVSGRDLTSVKKKVRLPLIYAGNHGYEILFPKKKVVVHPSAKKTKKLVRRLIIKLRKELRSIPGAMVEDKTYSASLHTRTLSKAGEKNAHRVFWSVVKKFLQKKQIKVTKGKKVLEIRPPAKWHKGKAVQFIMKKINKRLFPIYVGDDRTDEDAFAVMKKKGIGVRVGKRQKTKAHFSIPSVPHTATLLRLLRKARN